MTPTSDVDNTLKGLQNTAREVRRSLRFLRRWMAIAIAGVLLALMSTGAVGWDYSHGDHERAKLQCVNARSHITVTADAVDDVLDGLKSEVKGEPAALAAVRRVQIRADTHLAAELAALPEC